MISLLCGHLEMDLQMTFCNATLLLIFFFYQPYVSSHYKLKMFRLKNFQEKKNKMNC